MRYYETPALAPEKIVDESKEKDIRFFLMKVCIGILIAGAVGLFGGYIYRNYWQYARRLQGYSMLAGGIAWIIFILLAKSLGFSVSKLTYEKLRGILKNEVPKEFDDEAVVRKRIHNSMYKMDDYWTVFPSVYKGNPEKCIGSVITGPGGVWAVSGIMTNPKEKKFFDKGKPLLAGAAALEQKLNVPVGTILIFQKNKKHYKPLSEETHLFGYQELSSYMSHREPTLTEEQLEKINETLGMMSGADMSYSID